MNRSGRPTGRDGVILQGVHLDVPAFDREVARRITERDYSRARGCREKPRWLCRERSRSIVQQLNSPRELNEGGCFEG